jgi:mannose-6-phosphate isomerase-like protein (cupin superfamily)
MARPDSVVNLAEKLTQVGEHWSPKIVGRLNDLHVKVVKLEGEFVWHQHEDTDEFFLVLNGEMTIQLEDRPDVTLGRGEFFIVPRGVRHCPVAESECEVVLLEPAGTVNTGNAGLSALTADPDWI